MVLVKVKQSDGQLHEYYMDDWLKHQLDNFVIPALRKRDEDYVLAVDGEERSGKSTFASQIAKYVSNDFSHTHMAFSPQEFRKAIIEAKKGDCVIFDEAYRGFSSSGSLSEINKILVSLMMEMGQKNLLVIIVLPSFFELQKYVAIHRARCLFHIYRKRKTNLRYWRFYDKEQKKYLYIKGKQYMNYSGCGYARWGVFYKYMPINVEEYRKKKSKSLKEGFKKERISRFKDHRNKLIWGLMKKQKMTQKEVTDYCKSLGIKFTRQNISYIVRGFKEKEDGY